MTPQDNFRYRKVEQHILQLVDSKILTKGDKLPSLRSLSKQLQVSISTVSQAYLELEKKGIIAARERSGFFVDAVDKRLPPPISRPRPQHGSDFQQPQPTDTDGP